MSLPPEPPAEESREPPDLDRVFHALADPSRRKILGLLREAGELRVGDLAQAFSMSLNGVSKHLKVLERAELVSRRIDGREHWLRVEWGPIRAAGDWLDSQHHFWSQRLDGLAEHLEKRTERAEEADEEQEP